MIVIDTHTITSLEKEIKLYDYLPIVFKNFPSRKSIKKAIERGEVLVNGKKSRTGYWVKPGDEIKLIESHVNPPKEYKLDLEIVYEDEFMAIINKPPGIPVSGNQFRTIQNSLIGNIKSSKESDALKWPKPVHRLDGPTRGLLIIAKTGIALVKLGQQFEKKEIHKKYCSVCIGKTLENGLINFEIDGLKSETEFERIQVVNSIKNEFLSLLELKPRTGRTHQIRKHLSQLGHPIMGDKLYGKNGEFLKGKGLFLAAIGLKFNHPITDEELNIFIDIPAKFKSLLKREEEMWRRKFTNESI